MAVSAHRGCCWGGREMILSPVFQRVSLVPAPYLGEPWFQPPSGVTSHSHVLDFSRVLRYWISVFHAHGTLLMHRAESPSTCAISCLSPSCFPGLQWNSLTAKGFSAGTIFTASLNIFYFCTIIEIERTESEDTMLRKCHYFLTVHL